MQADRVPNPRFSKIKEQFDQNGLAIGFYLPDNQHFFKYNSEGGWFDQNEKYYNAKGILQLDQQYPQQQSDSDEANEDDQILDNFQQLLIEEDGGKIEKKVQSISKQSQKQIEIIFKQLIEKYLNKNNIRDFSTDIYIFFKIRSQFYEKVEAQVNKFQDSKSKQDYVVETIQKKIKQKKQKLIEQNPWIKENCFFNFSGYSDDNQTYFRYWYGYLKVQANNFFQSLEKVRKSKQFAVLQTKTLYALRSKFYSKLKMKDMVQKLQNTIKDTKDKNLIQIIISNLPQKFPLSFITDLFEFTGVQIKDIIKINIIDDTTAVIQLQKQAGRKFLNLEGYNYDKGMYLELTCKTLEQQVKQYKNYFNIFVDCEYKFHEIEIKDVMALENSKNSLLKHGTKQDKARFAVGSDALNRILMFRGQSINVIEVLLETK